jgi:hypothetical protein
MNSESIRSTSGTIRLNSFAGTLIGYDVSANSFDAAAAAAHERCLVAYALVSQCQNGQV